MANDTSAMVFHQGNLRFAPFLVCEIEIQMSRVYARFYGLSSPFSDLLMVCHVCTAPKNTSACEKVCFLIGRP